MQVVIAYLLSAIFFVHSTPMGGGKCETTADCVAPNVCSKWGWCQWTKIYGEEGPSQGSSAPGGGRAGQCKTSADCASRVPYCSKLGYCHGGRLPFDEAQLEITGDKEAQGYINNNPAKNSPQNQNGGGSNRPKNGGGSTKRNNSGGSTRRNGGNRNNSGSSKRNNGNRQQSQGKNNGDCPGGSLDACIEQACVPQEGVNVYGICAAACGKKCSK